GRQRPYRPDRATTWLKYVTFTYRPVLAPELDAFLADCFNREAVAADWPQAERLGAVVVKLPLPLGQCEAILLVGDAAATFRHLCETARTALTGTLPQDQLAAFAGWQSRQSAVAIPWRLLNNFARYLPPAEYGRLVFRSASAAVVA